MENRYRAKADLIANGEIIKKGTEVDPDTIGEEQFKRFIASGNELEIIGENEDDAEPEAVRPLNRSQMIERLKAIGIKIPFGATKDAIANMLKEATTDEG